MNGKLLVDSKYDQGSTFTIIIPQKVVNNEPIGDFSEAVKNFVEEIETPEPTLYAPKARILVVDDNEMNLEVIDGLLRDTKIKLEMVTSGLECIEKVKESSFDLILLDQMMPGMNGEQTLKIMMDENILKDIPVIALTADAIMGARESYIAKGFTDYLSKPVKYDRLEDTIKKYIPLDKQQERPSAERELPTLLIWGTDSERLKEEKERLSDIYKCTCALGEKARDKYLEKHEVDAIMKV